MSWETLEGGKREGFELLRSRVLGGWLIKATVKQLTTSITFVPDPNEDWVL